MVGRVLVFHGIATIARPLGAEVSAAPKEMSNGPLSGRVDSGTVILLQLVLWFPRQYTVNEPAVAFCVPARLIPNDSIRSRPNIMLI